MLFDRPHQAKQFHMRLLGDKGKEEGEEREVGSRVLPIYMDSFHEFTGETVL